MRIAVWDDPALNFLARSANKLAERHSLTVFREARRPLRDMLVSGQVDVALLPTISVFRDAELFDVLPAVAISSWDFPFVNLQLRKGMGDSVDSIGIDPNLAQEALITKVILKEHYDLSPAFKPIGGNDFSLDSHQDLDGILAISDGKTATSNAGLSIDLGRDWYELTHYPMVWGLFVMRTGDATGKAVSILRDIAAYAEVKREEWVEEMDLPAQLQHFYLEGIRYRLDDLATASLTSFQDYLYYNDAVEDMAPLPFYEVEDGEADIEEGPLL